MERYSHGEKGKLSTPARLCWTVEACCSIALSLSLSLFSSPSTTTSHPRASSTALLIPPHISQSVTSQMPGKTAIQTAAEREQNLSTFKTYLDHCQIPDTTRKDVFSDIATGYGLTLNLPRTVTRPFLLSRWSRHVQSMTGSLQSQVGRYVSEVAAARSGQGKARHILDADKAAISHRMDLLKDSGVIAATTVRYLTRRLNGGI